MAKKIFGSLLVVLGLVAGSLWFRSREDFSKIKMTSTESQAPALPSKEEQKKNQKEFFEAARAPLPTTATEISQSCRDLWTDLRKLDLGRTELFAGERTELPNASACREIPEPLASLQKAYLEKCASGGDVAGCQLATFYYRAQITEYLTKDEDLKNITDLKVLTDKLFAKFSIDPKSGVKVAERMLELDPTYYPAAKALLTGHLLEALDASGNPGSPVWLQVEADRERAQGLNQNDSEIAEVSLILPALSEKSPQKVRERAQAYHEKNPQSSLGLYYLAWAAYRENNPQQGLKYLESAHERFPSDQRVMDTLAGVKKNPNFYLTDDRQNSPFRINLTTKINPSPDTN